jgi:hypothetical protein
MKLLVNESNSGIRLPRADGGTLKLRPKGQPDDRKEIDDKTAASEPVQRFLSAKKVSLLSAEEASTRAAAEDKAKKKSKAAKKEAPPAPSPKKEEPKPEPKPVVEEPKKEEKKEEAPVLVPEPAKEEDKEEESFSKGKSKKKKNRR